MVNLTLFPKHLSLTPDFEINLLRPIRIPINSRKSIKYFKNNVRHKVVCN